MFRMKEGTTVVSAHLWRIFYKMVRDFVRRFKKPGPSSQAIKYNVNKFQRNGNAADEKHSGRPPTAQDNMQAYYGIHEPNPNSIY